MQRNLRRVSVDPGLWPARSNARGPRLEPVPKPIRVVFNRVTIAETTGATRVLEKGHPPTYYIPRNDVRMDHLEAVFGASSYCEWKGVARYFDVCVKDCRSRRSAWSYPQPSQAFSVLRNHLAFYAEPMDGCFVGDEQVRPEPGAFYGGWITDECASGFEDASE